MHNYQHSSNNAIFIPKEFITAVFEPFPSAVLRITFFWPKVDSKTNLETYSSNHWSLHQIIGLFNHLNENEARQT